MNNVKSYHWPSILQFAASLLAAVLLIFSGGMFILFGVLQLIEAGFDSPEAVQSFMLAASLLLGGGLVLEAALIALRRLGSADKPVPAPLKRRISGGLVLTLVLLLILPLALLAGNWVSRNSSLAWLLLPGLNLVVNGLPVLWLVLVGKRALPGGSRQRQWGIFTSGLVLGPAIILGIELLILLGFLLVAILLISLNPSLTREMAFLINRLIHTPPDPDNWGRILSPYILRPVILGSIFAYTAVIVPLVEEALKPIGLWLLAGRRLSPAEGFVGGLLSGAGFALFENLISTSAGGEGWALMVSTRITTALLHMLTSGLVGWGLAHAWSRGRFFRLAFAYSLSVTLHGIWNALGIASIAIPLVKLPDVQPDAQQTIAGLIVIGLGVMTGLNFIFYLTFNRGLRRGATSASIGAKIEVSQDQQTDSLPLSDGETPMEYNSTSDKE